MSTAKLQQITPTSRYKVLIVDDEKDMVKQIRTRFELEGFDVVEAHNGRDARTICESSAPHVVITDIRMPVMSGSEFLKDLFQGNPLNLDLPIVICMSGYSDLGYDDALKSGASAFFAKPIDPGDLVASSRSFLSKKELFQKLRTETEQLRSDAAKHAEIVENLGVQYMHEIKNHVTAIVSSLQRVLQLSADEHKLSEPRIVNLLERASRKGWELDEIIKTVYSSYASDSRGSDDVSIGELFDLAASFADEYLSSHGTQLMIDRSGDEVMVVCSPFGVRQILFNLFKNAVEAMGDQEDKSIFLRSIIRPTCVHLEIEDTGPGIPEDHWETVMSPGYTSKSGNLGIGLSFCARAAATFGGTLRVEKGAVGCKVILTIPRAES